MNFSSTDGLDEILNLGAAVAFMADFIFVSIYLFVLKVWDEVHHKDSSVIIFENPGRVVHHTHTICTGNILDYIVCVT